MCKIHEEKKNEAQRRRMAQKERYALEKEREQREYRELLEKHERDVILLKRRQELEKPGDKEDNDPEARARKRKKQRNKDRGYKSIPAAIRQFKAKLRVRDGKCSNFEIRMFFLPFSRSLKYSNTVRFAFARI